MSDNYRFYKQKAAESRSSRHTDRPLGDQLDELLEVVRWCEAVWAVEDRLDRQIGLS